MEKFLEQILLMHYVRNLNDHMHKQIFFTICKSNETVLSTLGSLASEFDPGEKWAHKKVKLEGWKKYAKAFELT